ncbi:hypothetical protein GOODEAATRI_001854 [Goodea atripinnis]|uniref:Uncharacterized protein n=1 Tax=Goodea atripinnis TaxID=208336 RepID=A0ABV0MEL7_9TELE
MPQLPQITAQLFEVSQRSMALHVNYNMCGEQSQSCSGSCEVLQLVNNFSLHSFHFRCYPTLSLSPVCSNVNNVVIPVEINLLTAMQGLWDGDIGNIRQCFTYVISLI